MRSRIHRQVRLGTYDEGLEIVEVGLTPISVDGVPVDYRDGLIEAQRRQHKQINDLAIAIGEYDLEVAQNPHGTEELKEATS